MRILFALPGLHRVNRGAENAFISIASELSKSGEDVTLIGSGLEHSDAPYRFLHAGSIPRTYFEHFPSVPCFRDDCAYEELTFVPGLLRKYRPSNFDVVVGCSFPFANWALRRPALFARRPRYLFVTQNGDWAPYSRNSEFRLFSCDGLVCTNPDFFKRNKDRWRCKLIPNGVSPEVFKPGPSARKEFNLPADRLIVLMVSALIPSKRVGVGIEAVSQIPDAHLVVAGDGPLRDDIESKAASLLPGRFSRVSIGPQMMPALYRSADVFLHLSKDEPSSLAFLEAMASGLPIVAHDIPQMRWIAGDDEFLLDTENPKDVAEHIQLARSSGSAALQKRLAKVEEFSWKRIAASYKSFLQELTIS